MEIDLIKNLIIHSYLMGALNDMNTAAMWEGYHADFAIFCEEKGDLGKLPLADWVRMVNDYKNGPDASSGIRDFTYNFLNIDVTGNAASVKLELIRNEKLIFTDYMTLLKFDGKWKIVTKVYHSHVNNPWQID